MDNLGEATRERSIDQLTNDRQEIKNFAQDDSDNCVVSLKLESSTTYILGAPRGWDPPGPKEGWMRCPVEECDEPTFASIDNPGNWSDYTLRPKFKDKGNTDTYNHHEMPASAQAVPANKDTDKRTEHGFEFHYNG